MSIAYYFGFHKKPNLEELGVFMGDLGFSGESRDDLEQNTRVYVFDDTRIAPREIEFHYKSKASEADKRLFEKAQTGIQSFGTLTTWAVDASHPDARERLRIIKEKCVKTEHDYYKHLEPERLKFYETALALKDAYSKKGGVVVISEQSGRSLTPNRSFP